MKIQFLKNKKNLLKMTVACAVVGCLCWNPNTTCMAQTSPASPSGLSPDLQEIVTLSRQQMSDDIITTYIKTSGKSYKLTADDIINLKQQGVSQNVITALIQTTPPASPAPSSNPPQAGSSPQPSAPSNAQSPAPPPLDASTPPGANSGSLPGTLVNTLPATVPPPGAVVPGLADNFFADSHLDPDLWETQSSTLASLASANGTQVLPILAFSPAGMQMSGIHGSGQFMGIKSRASFAPPFSFSATVSGMEQSAIPFDVYLVSADLQQWVSVAGHLGGRGGPRGGVIVGGGSRFFRGDVRIPFGGNEADYGVWINYAGSRLPISALGNKLAEGPIAGVPYTIQISAGADGLASVALLDTAGIRIAAQEVPIGTGPFYVVLAGRGGNTFANWQSVKLTPAFTPAALSGTPTLDYFQTQLQPYGNWVEVPGYGLCWQPAVDVGWRPYYDAGHWEYSDAGWYWQSDYPWGDIVFHYGRWAYTTSGWVWVPGYDYAPAWVLWRHADDEGYIGWAPLPPGAIFVNGGWEFNHVRVGVDFAFGLGDEFFTFVDCGHFFFDAHLYPHGYRDFVVPRERLALIYRHSVIENRYHLDHGHFVNEGLARERMAALTHHDIREAKAVHDLREHEEQRNAQARMENVHNSKAGNPGKSKAQPLARGGAHENEKEGRP